MAGEVTTDRSDRLSDPVAPVTGPTPRVASQCGSSLQSDLRSFAFLAVRSGSVGEFYGAREGSRKWFRELIFTNFRSHRFLHKQGPGVHNLNPLCTGSAQSISQADWRGA